jgi:hypothetical protein
MLPAGSPKAQHLASYSTGEPNPSFQNSNVGFDFVHDKDELIKRLRSELEQKTKILEHLENLHRERCAHKLNDSNI